MREGATVGDDRAQWDARARGPVAVAPGHSRHKRSAGLRGSAHAAAASCSARSTAATTPALLRRPSRYAPPPPVPLRRHRRPRSTHNLGTFQPPNLNRPRGPRGRSPKCLGRRPVDARPHPRRRCADADGRGRSRDAGPARCDRSPAPSLVSRRALGDRARHTGDVSLPQQWASRSLRGWEDVRSRAACERALARCRSVAAHRLAPRREFRRATSGRADEPAAAIPTARSPREVSKRAMWPLGGAASMASLAAAAGVAVRCARASRKRPPGHAPTLSPHTVAT